MKKRHIVFDVDDTLVNSSSFNQQMFVNSFLPFIQDFDDSEVREIHRNYRGKPMQEQFSAAAKALNLEVSPEKLVEKNEKLQVQNSCQIKMFDWVPELLKHAKLKGLTIHVCTNRDPRSLDNILKANNIREYFTQVISCKHVGHEKPDPYCLTALVESYGVTKKEFLYVGDSETDKKFANHAGIDYLFVDNYSNPDESRLKILKMLVHKSAQTS